MYGILISTTKKSVLSSINTILNIALTITSNVDMTFLIIYPDIMSYFLDEFGKKVRGYRELKGLTQEKLGELIDVSANTVGLWETGKSFIEYPTLVRLAKALDVEEAQLFEFKPQSHTTAVDQISAIVSGLSPAKQKQILDIIKTFE